MDPMAMVTIMMQQMQQQQTQMMQQMQARFDAELREARRGQRPQASTAVRAPYTGKPPVFDMETEKHKFPTWKIRWASFQVTSGLDNIEDEAVKQRAKRAALAQALSDATLCWVDNLDIPPEEAADADAVIERIEAYIKGTTNPLVHVVQLLGRRKGTMEPYEKFFLDIKERAKLCNFEEVDDVRDWFLKSCVCANIGDTETQKKLLLEKDLTFERAMDICLQDEKAAKTSTELSNKASETMNASEAEANRMSAHKAGKKPQGHGQNVGNNQSGWSRGRSQSRDRRTHSQIQNRSQSSNRCSFCGNYPHGQGQNCPARGKD
jgi:hypothetical protein